MTKPMTRSETFRRLKHACKHRVYPDGHCYLREKMKKKKAVCESLSCPYLFKNASSVFGFIMPEVAKKIFRHKRKS